MKPLSYFIGKIIGILLVSPIVILVHVIAGFWEAIMTIYEAIKAVIEVYQAVFDRELSRAQDLDTGLRALDRWLSGRRLKELKCDHSYEVTDSQGHDMECSKCGKLWRLYED